MKATINELVSNNVWESLNRFRGNMSPQDFLPIYTGLLMIIEKDTEMTGGEFRNRIGNRNANVTVNEIRDYGFELEKKGECPQGFFGNFAFKRLVDIDSIYLCDNFIHMWNMYEEIETELKGFAILTAVLETYRFQVGKSGDFSEPSHLRKLVCSLADVKEGESVYDPCMGAAGYAQSLVQSMGGSSFKFIGTELNEANYYLAHAVMIMGHVKDYNINIGNSLVEPIVSGDHQLQMFDKVITNPPFSVRLDEREFDRVNNDLYGRFHYGIPGKGNADWLFIEAAIAATKEGGKTVVVISNGPLFRTIEGKVRANILMEQDILEAVIQLPSGVLMPSVSIPVSILIFNKNKSSQMRGKVLSIDADDLGTIVKGRRSYRELSSEDIAKIVDIYNNPADIDGFARLYSFEEIANNDYNFNLVAIGKSQQATAKLEGYIPLEEASLEVLRGVQITPKALEEVKDSAGSHYLLNLSNIDRGKIVFSEDEDKNDRINPQKKWIKNYEVQLGDLLVAARGAFKCAVVEEDLPDCIASGNLIIIRLGKKYSPYVLKYFFESELGQQLISQLQSGVSASIINAAALAKVMIPGIEKEKMSEYESKIRSYVKDYEEMLRKAEEYKKSVEKELNDTLQLQRI